MHYRLGCPAHRTAPARHALALLLLTGGCAADPGGYPSLAQRPGEGVGFAEPERPANAPTVADPALDARIAEAATALAEARGAFDAAAAQAERRVAAARGSAAGTDAWLDAQTALAELDALRAASNDTVGTLEDMAATRAGALLAPYPSLDTTLEAARGAITAQTARIDALTRRLPAA